jgi:hypothetical protein
MENIVGKEHSKQDERRNNSHASTVCSLIKQQIFEVDNKTFSTTTCG